MSRFLSKELQRLAAYVPGEQPQDKKYIKLNTNESPYPPAPAVLEAINGAQAADLRLYSDPDLKALKKAIANRYAVSEKQVFCGNGSDEVLSFAFRAWGQDGGVAFPDLSYGFYPIFAAYYNLDTKVIPLEPDFTLNTQNYQYTDRMTVLANPNAPTGFAVSPKSIAAIAASNPNRVVLVDEAYVDFGGESCLCLLAEHANVVVVQTYSKSRQMAGARLGFAIASEELIGDLERLRCCFNPYNVNRLTSLAGVLSMEDEKWFKSCCDRIVATRTAVTEQLRQMGFTVLDSKTNFVFVKTDVMPGETLYQKLKENGILVRWFANPRIKDYLRISIGSEEEMQTLLVSLRRILQEEAE